MKSSAISASLNQCLQSAFIYNSLLPRVVSSDVPQSAEAASRTSTAQPDLSNPRNLCFATRILKPIHSHLRGAHRHLRQSPSEGLTCRNANSQFLRACFCTFPACHDSGPCRHDGASEKRHCQCTGIRTHPHDEGQALQRRPPADHAKRGSLRYSELFGCR